MRPLHSLAAACALSLSLSLAGPAAADEAMARLAVALAEDHALPRYAALADSGKTLAATLAGLCAGDHDLEAARAAYHRAMDDWMAVQHLRFGPADYLTRHSRLAFWPDKTNALSKQLARALSEERADLLQPDALAKASVALQGLPALERLLFDSEAPTEAAYGCALARAIGANVARMAAGVLRDWRDGEGAYAKRIADADESDDLFTDSREVVGLFFGSLHEALLATDELRLGRPLGEAGSRPRPRRAESWRSGRSLRNISAVLGSLESMVDGGGGEGFASLLRDRGREALAARLLAAFARARAEADAIEPPLSEAVTDPAQAPKAMALREAVRGLHGLLASEVAPALDLWIGFNALDGD